MTTGLHEISGHFFHKGSPMLSQKHSLNEWLTFVEAQHPQSVIELGLGRMRTMVERLGIEFDW